MRGVFTGGVLDFFLEKEMEFPYVIGVSAGACNAASYISKQIGRNKRVNIGFIRDHRYMSLRNYIREQSLFGMKFIFDTIPNELEPFDFKTFHASNQKYVVAATDCQSGQALYFEKEKIPNDIFLLLQASSSLPFLAPIVKYEKRELLDGGVADPIPLKQSLRDGNRKNVIVLTRDDTYRKTPFRWSWLAEKVYQRYPGLVRALKERHLVYNLTIEEIVKKEKAGDVFVIRPLEKVNVDRMEKNPHKLTELYEQGYRTAAGSYEALLSWLHAPT